MKHTIRCLGFCLILVLFFSCFKREEFDFDRLATNQEVGYDIALPIVDRRFTIEDILKDFASSSNFCKDQDSLLHIRYYSNSSLNYQIASHYSVGVKNSTKEIRSQSKAFQERISFPIECSDKTLSINSLQKASFKLIIKGENTFEDEATLKIDILNTENLGSKRYKIEANKTFSIREDFKDIDINASALECRISFETTSTKPGLVSLLPSIENFEYQSLEGAFKDIKIEDKSSINSSALQNPKLGKNISFKEAFFKHLTELKELEFWQISSVNSSYQMAYNKLLSQEAKMYETQEAIVGTKQVEIDLSKQINQSFSKIDYDFEGVLTKAANTTSAKISKNSKITTSSYIDIPLHIAFNNFEMQEDSIRYSIIRGTDALRHVQIKGIVKNTLPVDLAIYVYLLDNKNREKFVVLDSAVVSAAKIDPSTDHVQEASIRNFDIEFNSEIVHYIAESYKVRLCALLNTNGKDVYIYSDGKNEGFFDIRFGARVSLNLGSVVRDGLQDLSEEIEKEIEELEKELEERKEEQDEKNKTK